MIKLSDYPLLVFVISFFVLSLSGCDRSEFFKEAAEVGRGQA